MLFILNVYKFVELDMQRLKSYYLKEVRSKIKSNFGYKNINEVSKIKKVVVNRGLDESCQNSKIIDVLLKEISFITGQKPVIVLSKKAISGFKVKENMPIGISVTLRGDKMYGFLDRLINLSLPRIKDFQGVSSKSFDKKGSYSLGLNEQFMFPEIDFDKVTKIKGMDISIVTSAKSNEEAYFLLKELGMPFKS